MLTETQSQAFLDFKAFCEAMGFPLLPFQEDFAQAMLSEGRTVYLPDRRPGTSWLNSMVAEWKKKSSLLLPAPADPS